MRIATLFRVRDDISQEKAQEAYSRRAQWEPKAKRVDEHWFVGAQRGEWAGVIITEADDPGVFMQDTLAWADLLELRSYVSIGVGDGLRAAQEATAAATA
jgi:hypothetical protein